MKTRKIFSVILTVVMLMSFVTTAYAETFTDVAENHPYKEAIDFCKTMGYVSGTSGTSFSPDASLTRAQFSVIWCRSLSITSDNHGFKDITKLQKYYDSATIVLRSLGILSGTSDTEYSPLKFITREQLALIAMRTFNLGVADQDAYKSYEDNASVSQWARNGISSCINAKVFEGLYDGVKFEPNKPVTRAEICKLIYNIAVPTHTVTIAPLVGGTITASPTEARQGAVITLTITPDSGKRLKAGTLKYNGADIAGTTFIMPAADVTIAAEFEDIPVTLEAITITSPPAVTIYTIGQSLDLTDMIVTATYNDATTKTITGYTTIPAVGTPLNTEGTINIEVSYTEGEVTKTTSFTVQVNGT